METRLADRLPDLALFLTIAEADSLSAAARASGVSVARLSRRLAALEAALGVKLIDRTSRRFALTTDGEAYIDKLRLPMRELAETVSALSEAGREPRGTLRISASADFGATFLSPLIAAFAQTYPDIAFDIDLTPRRVDVAAERFDAAIRIGPLEDSALTSRRFATVPAFLYASPEYIARFGRPEHPSELARHACLPLPHMRGRARLERDGERIDVAMHGPRPGQQPRHAPPPVRRRAWASRR